MNGGWGGGGGGGGRGGGGTGGGGEGGSGGSEERAVQKAAHRGNGQDIDRRGALPRLDLHPSPAEGMGCQGKGDGCLQPGVYGGACQCGEHFRSHSPRS